MKLLSPDKQFSVDLCERCTEKGLPSFPKLEKLQAVTICAFCAKHICNDCNQRVTYEYGTHLCKVCKKFLSLTTGQDLKALGCKNVKYETIDDKEAIEASIKAIHQKYAAMGTEAVSKFLAALYQESKDRYARREKADKEAARIRNLKRELTVLEQEKIQKEKEILMHTPDELPF